LLEFRAREVIRIAPLRLITSRVSQRPANWPSAKNFLLVIFVENGLAQHPGMLVSGAVADRRGRRRAMKDCMKFFEAVP